MGQRRDIQISVPSTGDDEWMALRECLTSGWLTQGPKVAAFERGFAARHEVKHAIATSNCTTALHLILAALGVGPGDEVIVPALTWVATANAVIHAGGTPVFVDVDRFTYNIDIAQIPSTITPRTKAIIPVHLFGLCADMDSLSAVGNDIALVEDAACAAGGRYKGRSAGSLGRAGAFSFHPRKSITTGEGGMVTTSDGALAEQIGSLRNHGAAVAEEERHAGPHPYILPDFDVLGFNYRMTDLQGSVGLVQLEKLDRLIEERARWAEYYRRELMDVEWLRCPTEPDGYAHAWQAYVCYVDPESSPMPRNQLMDLLHQKGISTRPGTHAVHMLGYYERRYGLQPDDFPAARDCTRQTLAIPLHNRMVPEDYEYVVKAFKQIA